MKLQTIYGDRSCHITMSWLMLCRGSSHNYVAFECIPLIDCVCFFDTLSLGGIQFVDTVIQFLVTSTLVRMMMMIVMMMIMMVMVMIVLISMVMLMLMMMVIIDCANDDNDDTVIACGDEFDDHHHHHHIYSSYVSDVRLLISGKCLLLQRGRPQR